MTDIDRPLCPQCGERDRVVLPGEVPGLTAAWWRGAYDADPGLRAGAFCDRCLGFVVALAPRLGRQAPDDIGPPLQRRPNSRPAPTEAPPEGTEIGSCKSCGVRILWALTAAGKRMPLDARPDPAGNVVLIGGRAKVLTKKQAEGAAGDRYASHFATCLNAAAHRRKKA